MASIQITVPDAVLSRVLDAVSAKWGYNPGGGQTKAQFAKATLAAYLKSIVRDYEAEVAAKAAYDAAKATAESDLAIT